MGVRSAEWAELSGGACEMPALLIDGIMYRDSIPIVRMLATACPDETLDRSSQAPSHLPIRLLFEFADTHPFRHMPHPVSPYVRN